MYPVVLSLIFNLGESILSGQYNNVTVQAEVNTTLIPDRYSDVVTEFFTSKNITVTDGLAKITSSGLCFSTAAPIRDILITFTLFEISCSECGQKISTRTQKIFSVLMFFVLLCRNQKQCYGFHTCSGSDLNQFQQ